MIQTLFKNFGMTGAAALLITASAATAWAEDARVLPAGRSRAGLVGGFSGDISELFNRTGDAESVTKPYNLTLSAQNIQTVDPRVGQAVSALNATGLRYNVNQRANSNHGLTSDPSMPLLGDALSRGILDVDAVAQRRQYALSFQHGVTSKLSVGFMVPFIETIVNVKAGLGGANSAADLHAAIQNGGNTGTGLEDLEQALYQLSTVDTETLQALLSSKGYERFGNYRGAGIGDAVLGARYNLLHEKRTSGEWIASTQVGVTVPTGKVRKPNQHTAVDFGQGAWDIGVAGILNYAPNSLIQLSTGLHYTYRLPSYRLKRVRESPSDIIPENEERVWHRMGDKAWLTAGAKISPSDWLSFDASYEWYWKFIDQFDGPSGSHYGYSYLADQTDTYLETVQAGVSLNTIYWFLREKFPVPIEVSANAYLPTAGRNTPIAPFGTLELALFF